MDQPGETRGEPLRPAEVDVAALYLARAYGGGDTSVEARRRWAGRIRAWAARYPDEVHRYGRRGRRGVYDLAELDAIAKRLESVGYLAP